MKRFDFRSFAVFEILLLIALALFSMDFLPRNFRDFQRICQQTWSEDVKQYQICMEPFYRQTNLDKYAIGFTAVALIATPFIYFRNRKKK